MRYVYDDGLDPVTMKPKRSMRLKTSGDNHNIGRFSLKLGDHSLAIRESRAQNGDHDEEKPRNDLNNDEITILKSILDYYSKNGIYPFHNSITLHDFLKNSLQIDVHPWDLNDEISKLREKYINIQEKESDMNADDDHLNVFNEDKKKKGLRVEEEQDLSEFPFLKESLHFGKNLNALRLVGNSKLKELDEKWRKLQLRSWWSNLDSGGSQHRSRHSGNSMVEIEAKVKLTTLEMKTEKEERSREKEECAQREKVWFG
ncbi:hypothetical protein LOK49_LG01G01304 [Camellia lanceoleosa]|uniref:Uncharacterized protein n=1 Tax=Camellia lanceoleosa TaxID=1840588 RepID=A0ACC0IYA7_9ERIC|nr:hypothetical protein LOK49_LG01G01304 [Camellia lanceoleosa]